MRRIENLPVRPALTALTLLAALAAPILSGGPALAQTRARYCLQSYPTYVVCALMHVGSAQTRVSCVQHGGQATTRSWVCTPGIASGAPGPDGAVCSSMGERITLPVGAVDEDACAALCKECPASQWNTDPPPDSPGSY